MNSLPTSTVLASSSSFKILLVLLLGAGLCLFFRPDIFTPGGLTLDPDASGPNASSPNPTATRSTLPDPEPIGAEAYDERLRHFAGQDIDAQTLEDRARQAAEAYEARLEEIAAAISEDKKNSQPGDWRGLFAKLEKAHPPDREAVLEAYRREILRQAEFLGPLGLFPFPAHPAEVVANDNPIFRRYFSLAMYLEGQLAVTLEPAMEGSLENRENYLVNHCWVCIPPLVAHEVAPGHHVAYSRAAERIPNEAERLVKNRTHVVYHEGWGLYAEHLMIELGYYRRPGLSTQAGPSPDPTQVYPEQISQRPAGHSADVDLPDAAFELGALRLLYFRALRAMIDPAIHRREITPEEAVEIYRQKAGLSVATAQTEVARHLKDPVLKASYFIGFEQILELRRLALGPNPSNAELGAFHGLFLGAPGPIPEIARNVFGVELGAFNRGNLPA